MNAWQKVLSEIYGALIGTVVGLSCLYLFFSSGQIAGLTLGIGSFVYTFFRIRKAKLEISRTIEDL